MERRLALGERRIEVQRLGVHRQRGEQDVVGLGDGAAGPVQITHAYLELLEPQTALFDRPLILRWAARRRLARVCHVADLTFSR